MSSNYSTGQWVGTIVGAVIGYFTLGTGYVATAAMVGGAVGGAIDPPKGPKIVGPRLNDLSQQGTGYGAVMPRIYGTAAMMGNVFWIENNALRETSNTESSGGKGGAETTTYTYSATFALGLCEGPIAGVRRIWMTGKLIYDAGSDDIATIAASNSAASGFRIYTGEEDQLPDSRMQASLGVANTPAYRGLAYIVFDDLKLTEYGNTLLGVQIKVEIVSNANARSFIRFYSNPNTGVRFYDDLGGSGHAYILGVSDGVIKVGVLGTKIQYTFDVYGKRISTSTDINNEIIGLGTGRFCDKAGGRNVFVKNYEAPISSTVTNLYIEGDTEFGVTDEIRLDGHLPVGWFITGVVCDIDESSIMVLVSSDGPYPTTGSSQFYELNPDGSVIRSGACSFISSVQYITIGFSRTNVNLAGSAGSYDRNSGLIYSSKAWGGNPIYRFEIENGVMNATSTGVYLSYGRVSQFSSIYVINGDVHAFAGPTYDLLRFSSISSDYPTLGEIIGEEVKRSGVLTDSDIDTAGLTETVRGYRVSAVSAIRSNIDPLQGAWPFDVVQSGYKIKFKRRGGSSVATVYSDDLGAGAVGESAVARFTESRDMSSQLPARVSISYMDASREYDIGEQYAERLNTDSVNIQSIEMPMVLTADEAVQKAEILLYMYWLERYDVSFNLPPTYARLEPADVVTVQAESGTYQLRLTSVNYLSNGIIECTAKFHNAAVYTSTATSDTGTLPDGTINLPMPGIYQLLDIPLMIDELNRAGFPVAMSGLSSGWPGGTIFRSSDNGQAWTAINGFTRQSLIGYAENYLVSPIDSRMIDKKSTLTVFLYGGESLSSVTELQMLNGSNHFAYGSDGRWEIIAAQTCTLNSNGSYTLSSFLRGRYGTEWAMDLHVDGDVLVLIEANRVQFSQSNTNLIGIPLTYCGVTHGKSIDSDVSKAFTYRGVNLKPLSPVQLSGIRHAINQNDWVISWVRRSRISAEWRDYIDVPLDEAAEKYEIEITDVFGNLKRLLYNPTGMHLTDYSEAQQIEDFGAAQSILYVRVYQMSPIVGRGFPLIGSISRI